MPMTRRSLLRGLTGGAALLLGAAGRPILAAEERAPVLHARPGTAQLAPADMPRTAIWGFDGQVPGPVLRVAQGARLSRRFLNGLSQPATVHWHGIRIDNAMDGVPGLTQQAVAPGEAFLYDFMLPDAGTFWYHPHERSWEQMARGMYGALIVEEAEGAPQIDGDELLLIDDWRLTRDAQIIEDFDALRDRAHAGRVGNWITVNGAPFHEIATERHTRLRLRLVNVANARIFSLSARGMEGWIVALDGMPLARPEPLHRMALAPAQRIDLIVDITAEPGQPALLVSHERDGDFEISRFAVAGEARRSRLPEPAPLPANPAAVPGDVSGARAVDLVMEGGAMGGLGQARLRGEMMDMRALVGEGMAWAFNGVAGMPEAPLVEAARGEAIRIRIRNDTAWPHAMHLHGHHFQTVAADGSLGPLRDTILLDRGESTEIAFVADNPGDWLLHCHMLEHAAAGMTTWLRVA